MPRLAPYLDPRRSLAAAIGWLLFALSIGIVVVASLWVGDIVRSNVLDQRGRQLDRTAERVAGELNLNLALRLQSVRAVAAMFATELRDENRATLRTILENLQRSSPEFRWIGVADASGRVLAATQGLVEGTVVSGEPWFELGLTGARIGEVRRAPPAAGMPSAAPESAAGRLVSLIAPVIDGGGRTVGVVGTQMSTGWLQDLAAVPGPGPRTTAGTAALLLDADGTVLVGPPGLVGKHWNSSPDSPDADESFFADESGFAPPEWTSRVERTADGHRYLVARATPATRDAVHALGWHVVVLEPLHEATRQARPLQIRIAVILLGLGLLAAVLGAVLARRLTRDLEAIARSAAAIRTGATQRIAVPSGRNEAARLGRALDDLLTSLQREQRALQTLNAELDRRVAARTREIERLAEQARYDAVGRERLKIARDLHDTLAHSMMAVLTEIRLLKRLVVAAPESVAEELTRAEQTARQGLQEARAAIAQMRFNPVRDAGLAVALGDLAKQFVERTGIAVDYTSDAPAGAFADDRAETLFRIAEEAMRNVERHAGATRLTVSLRASPDARALTLTIADDGVGFDADAAHPGHYGLVGLREQARLIGAELVIRSAPQRGTTVIVSLAPAPDA
jgi:signal transduction histidine kinase